MRTTLPTADVEMWGSFAKCGTLLRNVDLFCEIWSSCTKCGALGRNVGLSCEMLGSNANKFGFVVRICCCASIVDAPSTHGH